MFKYYFLLLITSILLLSSCSEENGGKVKKQTINKELPLIKDTLIEKTEVITPTPICEWEEYLKQSGLTNIQSIDSTLKVELKYSTINNFMKKDMYGCLDKCFLQPDVTEKLKKAQQFLKEINPRLSLLVYDGVRPRSIQQYMWDILDMPLNEKVKFVSNPKKGSLHNFGAAVDITLFNLDSLKAVDMGAPYDHIGIEAWPIKEKLMLEKGILTDQHLANRKLLRKVMTKAKFFNIQTEWWHFNSCYRKKAYELYTIIEGFEVKPD